ncbi:uncharacterized protein LOC110682750 [Chenopodium quinoa]|uniref:uncharacterized protein LOC110682750 n=1 Tax=Chenopodium quinoa TaxID=63459 RepID=UPI000B789D1F|nr:uncharacterized protein LOC110682750 [Chenopodium quinoa]
MDGDETASKHSPESIFSFIDNEEDSKQKKYKKSGFEEFEGAWEGRVEPLLSCMNEMDHLYRKSGEVALNDLKGKQYLLFVCLYFHSQSSIEFEFESYYPQDFIPACHDLYSYRDDFEIVLVNSTNTNPDYPFLFIYPLRHFPMSSVVVPFDDYHRRSSIRQLLDPVNSGLGFDFKCLFLDVAHKTMLVGEPNSMSSLVAHLKELVHNSSFDALRSYQRLLKNMWPVNSCLPPVTCPIARIFKCAKPEYSPDINAMVSQLSPIQIGHTLDVKMLLSAGSNELGYLV